MTRSLVAGLTALALLGGCARFELPRGRDVEVQGDPVALAKRAAPLSVEVENFRGSVFVRSSPTADAPSVSVFAPGMLADGGMPSWITAATSIEASGPVLRVLAAKPDDEGAAGANGVDIYVTVGSLGAVRVRNAFGVVDVRGAQGSIDIANGLSAEAGGDVLVRTDSPLRGPVEIRTRTGDIDLRVGRGSAGALDIRGERGANVAAPAGAITDASATSREFQGRLGRLGEPFVLRALEGKSRIEVQR